MIFSQSRKQLLTFPKMYSLNWAETEQGILVFGHATKKVTVTKNEIMFFLLTFIS